MVIWVSPLSAVHDVAAKVQPSRVVSLLSPGDQFPSLDGVGADAHHKVAVHDISEAKSGLTAPDDDHIADIISFLRGWSSDTPLVIHCWAGVSRSTATAFIAACVHNDDVDEGVIADALRAASPTAWPNRRIIAIADEALARGGRMSRAVEKMGGGEVTVEATPFRIASRF